MAPRRSIAPRRTHAQADKLVECAKPLIREAISCRLIAVYRWVSPFAAI